MSNIRIFGLEYLSWPYRIRIRVSRYLSNPNRGFRRQIFEMPITDPNSISQLIHRGSNVHAIDVGIEETARSGFLPTRRRFELFIYLQSNLGVEGGINTLRRGTTKSAEKGNNVVLNVENEEARYFESLAALHNWLTPRKCVYVSISDPCQFCRTQNLNTRPTEWGPVKQSQLSQPMSRPPEEVVSYEDGLLLQWLSLGKEHTAGWTREDNRFLRDIQWEIFGLAKEITRFY